jgi:hypothetical protein
VIVEIEIVFSISVSPLFKSGTQSKVINVIDLYVFYDRIISFAIFQLYIV